MLSGCWTSRLMHARWLLGKSGSHKSSVWHERSFASRSNRQWSQEKPLSFSLVATVPQTDTGGRDEYSQALERTQEKELGKLTP